jgi:hypothetical protein
MNSSAVILGEISELAFKWGVCYSMLQYITCAMLQYIVLYGIIYYNNKLTDIEGKITKRGVANQLTLNT